MWQKNILSRMALRKPGLIALFDVDGTLTAPRKVPHFLLSPCFLIFRFFLVPLRFFDMIDSAET